MLTELGSSVILLLGNCENLTITLQHLVFYYCKDSRNTSFVTKPTQHNRFKSQNNLDQFKLGMVYEEIELDSSNILRANHIIFSHENVTFTAILLIIHLKHITKCKVTFLVDKIISPPVYIS